MKRKKQSKEVALIRKACRSLRRLAGPLVKQGDKLAKQGRVEEGRWIKDFGLRLDLIQLSIRNQASRYHGSEYDWMVRGLC
ncbi:hypothetical protein MUP79_08175 [Candidatus Bathyarchaeota archaeon]|nr:hypothetical protein [Candidatus Bathyarchaeota archaeon]